MNERWNFFSFRHVQPPIEWVPNGPLSGVKAAGLWSWQSPPSSSEIKNVWSYTSIYPIRLHGVVLNLAVDVLMRST